MLETEIKTLNATILRLIEVLEGEKATLANEQLNADIEEAVAEAVAELPKAETPKTVRREDLQAMCLGMVREDRSLKTKIKDTLAEYGANVMADVPEDKLAELKGKLEKLA